MGIRHCLEAPIIRVTAKGRVHASLAGSPCAVAATATVWVEGGAFIARCATKEETVTNGYSASQVLLESNGRIFMHPILHHDWCESLVPVCATWPIDGEWSRDTIGVLCLVVAVIPRMTVLVGCEVVGICVAKRDWTLRCVSGGT